MGSMIAPPIGVEAFDDMRRDGYYYVDKTGMIKELLENNAKVTLFTRPRRFGKTLTMSMLRKFFEIGTDPTLFDGLAISQERELCETHMGKYPVISLTLKDVDGMDFMGARDGLWSAVKRAAVRYDDLQDSVILSNRDKECMYNLSKGIGNLQDSLETMSRILSKEYSSKVIILIDEYDVPLAKADEGGFYDEMVKLIRLFLSSALKTNDYLQFAVLTGCLRIAKESIFTGLNNLKAYSVLNHGYDEWFGFTEGEVRDMFSFYGLEGRLDETREWYDGYRFGDADVYCPWDVVNRCHDLWRVPNSRPEDFWANSSSNGIITRFADMADKGAKRELELLEGGGTVTKHVRMELTYRDLYSSIDNLWSALLNTGYLTCRQQNEDGSCDLAIPNNEIRHLFRQMLDDWFSQRIRTTGNGLATLWQAAEDADAALMEEEICRCLKETISYMDGGNSAEEKESFYHAFLLGLLKGHPDWILQSNREAGNGRADITVKNTTSGIGVIIEVKYAADINLLDERACEALSQIDEKRYGDYFRMDGVRTVRKYGVAFYRKMARVKAAE